MNTQYGLLGYPLGHSFSARFFADKFAREGIQATYTNFAYADLGEAVSHLRAMPSLGGFNVTIPYKETIIPHLDALSPQAAEIGAVNVVKVVRDAEGQCRWIGENSDCTGFAESIRPLLQGLYGAKALVLGTGGVAKAVAHTLRKQWAIAVQPVSRSPRPGVMTYAQLTEETVRAHPIIVNCTPVGMFPHTALRPGIPYSGITNCHVLFDTIYNPEETQFLREGRKHGASTMNGLEMLHIQAREAWRMWTKLATD